MSDLLQYGLNRRLAAPAGVAKNWTLAPLPKGTPVANLRAATRAAIDSPLDFPSLEKALLEEDRVAIVLEAGVPQASEVVAAVVEAVLAAGTSAANITIVCDPRTSADPRQGLSAELGQSVGLDRHDAANHDRVEFLTSNRKGRAVYLNRSICDAEVVIALGVTHSLRTSGDLGMYGGLYPTFSEADTQKRFRNLALLDASSPFLGRARMEVDRVGRLAGVVFAVQVVPGAGDSALGILAGHPETVAEHAQQQYESAWSYAPRGRAELVVASLSGGPESQTWEQLAATLTAVIDAVEDDGAVLLCSDVSVGPGSGVQRLGARLRPDQMVKRLEGDRPIDTLTAMRFAQAREHAQIYLLSQVERDAVDRLGIESVEGPDEVFRLMHRHTNCLLLQDARHALLTLPSRYEEDV